MKKLLCIILVALLSLSLVGCVLNTPSGDGGGTQTPKTTKLVVLSAPDGSGDNMIISPYIPDFEKATGIDVDFTEIAMDNLHTQLTTIFAAKSAEVDVLWTWVGWTAEFGNAGHLEDLTDKLTKDEWDKYVPGALNCVTYKGRRYGLPKFFSIRGFYCNELALQKAGITKLPETWDEMVEYAKATTNKDKDEYGLLFGMGNNNNLLISFQDVLVLTGGQIVDSNDNIKFNEPEGVEALEKIVELVNLGVIDPASYGIVFGTDKRERWNKGLNAMTWEWAATYVMANDPAQSAFAGHCVVTRVPSIKTTGAITGSEGHSISKYSQNKEAALDLIKFLSSNDVQKKMVLKTGWYPVVNSLFEDQEVLASSPLFQYAAEQSKYPTMRFAAPYTTELQDTLGPELLLAVQGKKTAKQALDDAAAKVKDIISQYK
ncbi:MAG TPA: extracellular solute-binding protein [Clostridiaceae bacterium]|nr:extracellular solute-binding protein [Clostridiaceae bacterium]